MSRRTVTTSHCYHVALSPRRTVTTSHCHHVALLPRRTITTSYCHHVALSPRRTVTTSHCHHDRYTPDDFMQLRISCHKSVSSSHVAGSPFPSFRLFFVVRRPSDVETLLSKWFSCILDANVHYTAAFSSACYPRTPFPPSPLPLPLLLPLSLHSTTYQTFSFFFRVMGVPYTSRPTFDTPGYYDITTDALVNEFPNCMFYREPTAGNWNCTVIDKPIKLLTPYQPVNTLKKLVDAGLFA
ncbi:unnamed protein product, partial [Closterium sp. NIES-54]